MAKRTRIVNCKVTEQELARIRHLADAAMTTTSGYLRSVALSEDVRLRRMTALQAELRKLGGLQKHLATLHDWTPEQRRQFDCVRQALIDTAKLVQEAVHAR